MEKEYKFETLQLHAGQKPDAETLSRAVPLYQTTSYLFKSAQHGADLFELKEPGYLYTRIGNPTCAIVEERLAALEGGSAALLVASGQAAATMTILAITEKGDSIVSSSALYGGTHTLFHHTLTDMGREILFVDAHDVQQIEQAITPKTKAVYIETIGNPGLDVPDFSAIADIAHTHAIPLIVDNTFAGGGYIFKPLHNGADICIESCTKWIGGHGLSIGGIIIESGSFDWGNGKFPAFTTPDPAYHGLVFWNAFGPNAAESVANQALIYKLRLRLLRDIGAAASPFNAWTFLIGLETLSLRMQRHCENAFAVAKYLESHPKVERVLYPGLTSHPHHAHARKYFKNGFGSVVCCELKGGKEAGLKMINNVKLWSHLANIGDAKSLIIHPASTTHQQLSEAEQRAGGVTPGFIRLSVGIEHIDDIIADLAQAMDTI